MKYIGLPLTFGFTIFGLLNQLTLRKRRAALEGKVVVITGASSGIGEALAHAFYEQGCKVVLAARRKLELERVKQDLMSMKLLNLTDFDHLNVFVQKVYDQCGNIDILINNGGISYRGSILETKLEVDKEIMTVNYFGSVALTKVQGLIAIPDRAAYAASKHALQAFGDSLRSEMHQHNVNVTVVSPGYIKTNISLNALTGSGSQHGAGFTPEYTASKILDGVVQKKNELVVSQFLPNLAIFLRQAAPSLYFWFMYKRAIKTSAEN
ncbi:Dehydrogenase/reductase SDR family protein 7-like protein [Operophtera brumata]|uniref:Dehydrogenase/reductase SDR family protein 7-like protein n=1 Tax=Operophtera brumata TaxID=104452 RepID=A0A0L7LK88_OPEBR|nr:Dehydrogenase/reductase SDR family protein 7-like protein [Operophtera brumata]